MLEVELDIKLMPAQTNYNRVKFPEFLLFHVRYSLGGTDQQEQWSQLCIHRVGGIPRAPDATSTDRRVLAYETVSIEYYRRDSS